MSYYHYKTPPEADFIRPKVISSTAKAVDTILLLSRICNTTPHPSACGCHLPLKGKALLLCAVAVIIGLVLAVINLAVKAALFKELAVGTLLHYLAVVDNEDNIRIHDG